MKIEVNEYVDVEDVVVDVIDCGIFVTRNFCLLQNLPITEKAHLANICKQCRFSARPLLIAYAMPTANICSDIYFYSIASFSLHNSASGFIITLRYAILHSATTTRS